MQGTFNPTLCGFVFRAQPQLALPLLPPAALFVAPLVGPWVNPRVRVRVRVMVRVQVRVRVNP